MRETAKKYFHPWKLPQKIVQSLTQPCAQDEVAEWLRRWTANPLGSARVGSNPILVEGFKSKLHGSTVQQRKRHRPPILPKTGCFTQLAKLTRAGSPTDHMRTATRWKHLQISKSDTHPKNASFLNSAWPTQIP